ncbi:MAG TPA: DUF6455 family protein [Kiloniellales bacterium]|nr:DUF6455 family protein [Kiloniellales bacterium]
METTLILVVRLGLAALLVAGVVWALRLLIAHFAEADRPLLLSRMLRRLGIVPEALPLAALEYHLPTAARICLHCRSKAECEAWLAEDAPRREPPAFCPNRSYLQLAAREQPSA